MRWLHRTICFFCFCFSFKSTQTHTHTQQLFIVMSHCSVEFRYSPSLINSNTGRVQAFIMVLLKYYFLCLKATDKLKSDKRKCWISSSIHFGPTCTLCQMSSIFFHAFFFLFSLLKGHQFLSHDAVYFIQGHLNFSYARQ